MRICEKRIPRQYIFHSLLLCCRLLQINARFIRITQEWKEPELIGPDYDYDYSENLPTGLTSRQTIYDTSPEWMHDGCIDLAKSAPPWLFTELVYSPARVNHSRVENIHAPWLTEFENPPYGEEPDNYQEIYNAMDANIFEDENFLHEYSPGLTGGDLLSRYGDSPERDSYEDSRDYILDKGNYHQGISGNRVSEYIGSLAAAIDIEEHADENTGSMVEFEPGSLNALRAETGTGNGKDLQDVRDDVGMYGFWGQISIRFVSDYSRWHITELVKEEA
ncbi:hypothetical protein AA313_de0207258 [Arthrobotrys entomopaga]|nr:hypothetical protein AA313_de0207258 [Arthrobotrys entomopaga]